jgi:hypothetical protein
MGILNRIEHHDLTHQGEKKRSKMGKFIEMSGIYNDL